MHHYSYDVMFHPGCLKPPTSTILRYQCLNSLAFHSH